MNLDVNALLLGSLVGSIGFVAFVYGRRQRRIPQIVAGLLLMIFPYFVSNLAVMAAIAVGLIALMWLSIRAGY